MAITRTERIKQYAEILSAADKSGGAMAVSTACRLLCQRDLFYLLAYALGREDVRRNDWLYDRCNEVQWSPDGHLDLWSREHYKSTIITFAKTIQDILNDPDITIGIFSHTKPIARSFLRQIKRELESNVFLQQLFPEILYQHPKKEAPAMGNSWSDDSGITVKRSTNPKEATIEAHGLVDGQPTSKHFKLLIYDDVVTVESVTSPEMIQKTTDALAVSFNLGAHGGRRRFIGTRYHFADTYREVISRQIAKPRIYPATDNGKADGRPIFLSPESLMEKRREMGPYVFGCQMLLDPKSESEQGFMREWLRYYDSEPDLSLLNVFLVVDPANSKRKRSDYTTMWVIGLGEDRNYYIIDCVHDRLNLKERTETLFSLHREYVPQGVGYEHYGMQADIQHIQEQMDRLQYRFAITELGGSTPKPDRIKGLQPKFEDGRVWLPKFIWKTNKEGRRENMIQVFIDNEYMAFPVCVHDDMLDCMANIIHPDFNAQFPRVQRRERKESWRDRLAGRSYGGFNRPTAQAA